MPHDGYHSSQALHLLGPCTCRREMDAAADAFATGGNAGIGGWWRDEAGLVWWYSLQLTTSSFPPSWSMPADLQRAIACLELLAQIALVAMRARSVRFQRWPIRWRHSSDNAPTEGAVNRLFTNAKSLCYFLQLFSVWSEKVNACIEIDHIPGQENDLADGLSRGFEQTLNSLDPDCRFVVSMEDLLNVRQPVQKLPPHAPWPERLRMLQLSSTRL